eukprot:TRINITY_DN16824_c0_g1_i1.p1 TRINITY_DN16824_c0_g1~~TRINITY_DN16824_c0_g1_i1.p1  ORF type:complete len:1243 (+),score=266.24 TRINITY_DN16824_c0_g1_i1:147-3731(+)
MQWPGQYLVGVAVRFGVWFTCVNAALLCRFDIPVSRGTCDVQSGLDHQLELIIVWLVLSNSIVCINTVLSIKNFCDARVHPFSNKFVGIGQSVGAVGCGFCLGFLGPLWGVLVWLSMAGNMSVRVSAVYGSWRWPKGVFRNLSIRLLHFWDIATDVGTACLLDPATPEGALYIVLAAVHSLLYTLSHFCLLDGPDNHRRVAAHMGKALLLDMPMMVLDIIILTRGSTDQSATGVFVLAALSSLGELGTVGQMVTDFLAQAVSEKRMRAVVALAEGVAASLARYDLPAAEQRIAAFDDPGSSGIIQAFQQQIANLASYRPFLPHYILPAEDDADGADNATSPASDRRVSDLLDSPTIEASLPPVPKEPDPPFTDLRQQMSSAHGASERTDTPTPYSSSRSSGQVAGGGMFDTLGTGQGVVLLPPASAAPPAGVPGAAATTGSSTPPGPHGLKKDSVSTSPPGSGHSRSGKNSRSQASPTASGGLALARMQLGAVFTRSDASVIVVAVGTERTSGAVQFVGMVLDTIQRAHGTVIALTSNDSGQSCIVAEWNARRRCTGHSLNACSSVQVILAEQRRRSVPRSAPQGLDLNPLLSFEPAPTDTAVDVAPPPRQWALSVASGMVILCTLGNDVTRAQLIHGPAVATARALVSLARQLSISAVIDDRVFQKVRSEVNARIVDVVQLASGSQHLVYQIVHTSGLAEQCYVQAFSDLRQQRHGAAAEGFMRHLLHADTIDTQALRLYRVALMLEQQGSARTYLRRQQSVWENIEDEAASVPLPRELETFLKVKAENQRGLGHSMNQSGTSSGMALSGPEDESRILERHLNRLVSEVAENTTEALQMSQMRAEGEEPAGTSLVKTPLELPTMFTDAKGRRYHRSSTCLGRGAYGAVWLGMGEDGGMVAVKSFNLTGDSSARTPGPEGITETLTTTLTCMIDPEMLRSQDLREDRSMAYSSRRESTPRGGGVDVGRLRKQVGELVGEVSLMISLKHDNVVQYLGCAVEGGHAMIVMEYLPGGSLQSLMQQFGGVLPTSCVRRLLVDIVGGVEFIHGNGIVHRDLKPANVLVTVEGQARIADFGASAQLRAAAVCRETVSAVGTPRYMAPEQTLGKAVAASDIWAVGLMVCELHTGHQPWAPWQMELHPLAFATRITRDTSFAPTIPQDLPPDAQDMARLCTLRDPAQRPTAQALLSHSYLLS